MVESSNSAKGYLRLLCDKATKAMGQESVKNY